MVQETIKLLFQLTIAYWTLAEFIPGKGRSTLGIQHWRSNYCVCLCRWALAVDILHLPFIWQVEKSTNLSENLHILMVIYAFLLGFFRLICACSSSGSIRLVRVINRQESQPEINVEEFARLDIQGDVFSSPVMIGGRIFVGCRDDYVHCINLEIQGPWE